MDKLGCESRRARACVSTGVASVARPVTRTPASELDGCGVQFNFGKQCELLYPLTKRIASEHAVIFTTVFKYSTLERGSRSHLFQMSSSTLRSCPATF